MGEQQQRSGWFGGIATAIARGEHVWTPEDDRKLMELRIDEGLEWDQVALEMGQGLSRRACASRYDRISGAARARRRYHAAEFTAPNTLSIDRDKRTLARERMDLTGLILGDPPPGYSALDRMRARQ